MSHHFDTPTAREDPRINLCDFYLFRARPGSVTMAMTVNPDAGLSAPDIFREEGLYAFRFDLDGDAQEDCTLNVTFGAPRHADGDEHAHVQDLTVRLATGAEARSGNRGEVIAQGRTGDIVDGGHGVRAFAGLAPDLFAGDAVALGAFRKALFEEHRFHPAAFENKQNFFLRRNVTAIVLEVPTHSIGSGRVAAWATVSLFGHAPEVQVSRWGLPLLTNIFIPDQGRREMFNRATPPNDRAAFSGEVAAIIETLTRLAGSAPDPAEYGRQLAARLLPAVLPYQLDTPATFEVAGFNGRGLADDAMDVMLSLAANSVLVDGVAPEASRLRADFPYFGAAYTRSEQQGVARARPAR